MALPEKIEAYLRREETDFDIVRHSPTHTLEEAAQAAGLETHRLVRAVLLEDGGSLLLAVLRASEMIDFEALSQVLGRELKPAPSIQVRQLFADCQPGSIPPLAGAYGIPAVIDRKLTDMRQVVFEPGVHDQLIIMDATNFLSLQNEGSLMEFSIDHQALATDSGMEFTMPSGIMKLEELGRLRPASEILETVSDTNRLPSMPTMAQELLRLRADPRATVSQLANIVVTDPSLSAQIVRYSRSAFFNYHGQVDSIETAIARVLGFDAVLNLALGLATGSQLRYQASGVLSLENLWRESIYTASIAQALAGQIKPSIRPKSGTAYLAGLLSNFGYFVLGHLFPPEMYLLNRLLAANESVPVMLVEKRMLGVTHTEIGARLLAAWNMPSEVIVTQREHHNEYFRGEHAVYANLIMLAAHLANEHGVGTTSGVEAPTVAYTVLGLDRERVAEATERVMEAGDNLDRVARDLAAA